MNPFSSIAERLSDDGRAHSGGDDCPPSLPDEAYAAEFDLPWQDSGLTKPPQTLAFRSAADLKGKPVPDRQWLVEDIIPAKTVTLLMGDGGTGKSLLALQLAVATATGTRWLGRSVRPGPVLFLSAEDDDDELHRRLDAIAHAGGIDYDAMKNLILRSLAGESALLALESPFELSPTPLYRDLEKAAADLAPALIVIDTLADVYPANENDRAKVRQFVGLLRRLAIRRNAAVLLLGHPSVAGMANRTGTSGSTAWNNSVRSRLYMHRITDGSGYEPDPDHRLLSLMKANYSRKGQEIGLSWQGGVFVADAGETGLDRMAANAKAERVFLKQLRSFNDQGRYVSPSKSVTFAPSLFAKHPESEGVTKRAFEVAMENLLRACRIIIAQHGRGQTTRSHLEVAP